MYQCPINYFTDNLIFNVDRSCWAAYKLAGYDYDFLDDNLKISMLYKMAKFLAGIMSDAQVLIVPVEQDSKEHFKKLTKNLDKSDLLYEKAKYHILQTENYLEQRKAIIGESNDYRSYILVKLADYTENETIEGLKEGYKYFIKNPINALNVWMNLDTKDILMSKLNKCIKKADDWLYSQNQKMRLTELTTTETQWLFRRMAFRGTNQKVKLFREDQKGIKEWKPKADIHEVGRERIIKPYGKDVVNLFSGSIHPGNRMLRIVHDKNIVSYQSFLAVTNIPDTFEYPGMEWIYMLQKDNLQAEVCIHIHSIEHRAAKRKVEGKKTEIDSQIEHIENAKADIPEDLLVGKEYADALEAELKAFKAPLLETSVTICVAADNEEELEQRVVTVENLYEDFVIERPLADQIKLFMQCIPSVGPIVKEYKMQLTPLALASGVIGVTHELGDKEGPYIGTTGSEEKRVFLNMGTACLRNKSASATFYGNLGYGKSFNANLLVVLNVLYGGYGLIFDPKAERSHWEKELTILSGMITTVTLSGDSENKGKLDPYNLYRDDLKAADELAINVLAELLEISSTSVEYTAILEAQRIMGEQELPSMNKLIETLGAFPETDELYSQGKFLARRLKLQSNTGMSQLLFGDGTEEAISLDNRLNILQINNLKLPGPEKQKESYTTEERLSTVLMAVISNFAKKFVMTKRPVFKLVLFDESWSLGKTVEGVNLYDFLTRMGRSLYSGCIFNGHSVLDLPSESIKNTISYKFCFHTNNDAEADRMCEYMGIEPTVGNKETLKNLENGECLFQDLDGHVGILKFDAVFGDLIDVFSTTPKGKAMSEAEVKESVVAIAKEPTQGMVFEAEGIKEPECTLQPEKSLVQEEMNMLNNESIYVLQSDDMEQGKELEENTLVMQTFEFSDEELFRKEEV